MYCDCTLQYIISRVRNSRFGFWTESLVFCERKRDIALRSRSLFLKERRERFAHSHSFLKSDECNLFLGIKGDKKGKSSKKHVENNNNN